MGILCISGITSARLLQFIYGVCFVHVAETFFHCTKGNMELVGRDEIIYV